MSFDDENYIEKLEQENKMLKEKLNTQTWKNVEKAEEVVHNPFEELQENLKTDINEFLYNKVPHTMTIGEFEKLSSHIYGLIMDIWE